MMMRYRQLMFLSAALVVTVLTAAACSSGAADSTADAAAATPVVVQLAPENVATAIVADITSGPFVTGQLTPVREATVRAQVGGPLVSLTVDRGQSVRQGATIGRISARDLDASLASAEVAVTSATNALAVATSEAARTESLVKGGALAVRDLEQARNMVAGAEAQLASTQSREASVRQQLDDTIVRAPISGIVSERPANAGDIVSPGTALVTIVDPTSMRLEAAVTSDQVSLVQPGATVRFRIRNLSNDVVTGTIERLSPVADPITRQITIFVTLPNTSGRLIGGLFAEGRVESETRHGVIVPMSVVDETGPTATVTRIRNGKAERVTVELGIRQADAEVIEITSGIAEGDILIRGAAKTLSPGTPVRVVGLIPETAARPSGV
ncbi:MAG: efflux RND transporter periplasmic adaptor subunit [Acidobacteria bacterium]|nr:efflux RND transporter periplasmic adaptor subunit [Acidobacteriota bacterium]